jgi:hypothetical protein
MTTTTVSPIAAFAGGVVIGATATAVVIKYQENIKATGAAVGRRAKSLFGKKPVEAPVAAVAEVAPVEAPVAAVAEVAPVEAQVEAVAEAPSITIKNVEGVARLAELLSPSKTDPRSLVGEAIVQPGLEKPDIVILTEEVRATLEESMKKPLFSNTVPRHKQHHRRK